MVTNTKSFSNHHMIDTIFILILFTFFTSISVFLIIFGANIYKNTTAKMNNNFSTRTCSAYITEKIRQSDLSDSVDIITKDNTKILTFTQIINNIEYSTYLYLYNGYLHELFSRTALDLPLDAGQPIFELDTLDFQFENESLIKVTYTNTITNSNNISDIKETVLYINLHSHQHIY